MTVYTYIIITLNKYKYMSSAIVVVCFYRYMSMNEWLYLSGQHVISIYNIRYIRYGIYYMSNYNMIKWYHLLLESIVVW